MAALTPVILQHHSDPLPLSRGPVDLLWPVGAQDSPLSDFVQRSQPWANERVALPTRLRRSLWASVPVQLAWGIWLTMIAAGVISCDGPICTVATLDHHIAVLLLCCVSLVVLVGLAPFTRGLSRCNGPEVLLLGLATAAGGGALLGIAALAVGVLIAALILVAFVATLSFDT